MLEGFPEHYLVAAIGIFGGILLGLAARLDRFCTLGAIEDVLYGGSDTRLRMWGVAIGTAVCGSFALMASGAVAAADTYYLSIRWMPWASVLGGLAFGHGMALAGSCGYGAIARLGGGDLRSFVILLVMGVSTYVVLSGPLAPIRDAVFPQTAVFPSETPPGIAHAASRMFGVPANAIGIATGIIILGASLASRALWQSPKSIVWAVVVGMAVISGWAGTAWVAQNGFDALPVVSHSSSTPLGETILW